MTTTATPWPTPTAGEALAAVVLCERPERRPRRGRLLRVLAPTPNEAGEIRVLVFPHDGRAVRNTGERVWILWPNWSGIGST